MSPTYRYDVNDFPDELFDSLKKTIQKAKHEAPERAIAAFDADGTLWDTDVGELFLEHQIAKGHLDLPEDPFEFYKELRYKNDAKKALDWIVTINAGQKINDVRALAKECYEQHGERVPVFKPMQELISFLHAEGVEVYIVTASCKWAVEPFGALFTIPAENVVGSEAEVKEGVVTDKIILRTQEKAKLPVFLKEQAAGTPSSLPETRHRI